MDLFEETRSHCPSSIRFISSNMSNKVCHTNCAKHRLFYSSLQCRHSDGERLSNPSHQVNIANQSNIKIFHKRRCQHRYVCHMSYQHKQKVSSLIFLVLIGQLICCGVVYPWSLGNLLMAGSQAVLSYADTVAIGAQKGLNECAKQFAFERWSCPESIFTNAFTNSLPLNREIAFVQAVISAGIVHTVTKNCNTGELDNCKCSNAHEDNEEATRKGFRWAGCSDNTALGSKVAIAFLDDRETGHDLKAQIRLHNNEAGRNAIKETMIRICKCHGVSGSCSLQTCWMRINEFREVGHYLKKAYRKAVKIESNGPMDKSLSTVPKWKLVYLQESPDYCVAANVTIGFNGTLGRNCSMRKGKDVPVEERKSCRRLCKQCGYKVKREKRTVTTSCNCKFKFCCEVECQKCSKEEYTYVCAPK